MNLNINEEDVNLLFIAAFRYSLGRMSYMPSAIAQIILSNKELLTQWQRELYAKEVHEHIETWGNAGMDFDTAMWLRFAEEIVK